MLWLSQEHSRFCFISLLLHDIQDHAARFRAPLRRGVDGDGLLGSAGVLLPMDVNPAAKQPAQTSPSDGSGVTRRLLRAQELRKTRFHTCSSFGVNLGVSCIYQHPAHTSPGSVWFRAVRIGFGPRSPVGPEVLEAEGCHNINQCLEGAEQILNWTRALNNLAYHHL